MKLKHLSLFSGIGGFDLGLEWTGCYRTVVFCEFDKKAQLVLKKHWPKVPIYNDVKTLTNEKLKKDKIPKIDIITGGFPCQDISNAGKGVGITGTQSGLWKEMSRIIREVQPRYVIVENVSALLTKGLSTVLGDLASIRYDAEWNCIPASAIGAPHQRDRVWIIAYPNNTNKPSKKRFGFFKLQRMGFGNSSNNMAHTNKQHDNNWRFRTSKIFRKQQKKADIQSSKQNIFGYEIGNQWKIEPPFCGVADGIPHNVDRLRQLGNAIVPQIAYILGSVIIKRENELYRIYKNKRN